MNKRILFPSLAMLAIATITVVGCSKDDKYDEFDTNLSINYNTLTTRSVAEDVFIGDTETIKRQYYNANTRYNKVQAGCGITMLVDIWINEKGRSYFEVPPSDCPKTAQQMLMSFWQALETIITTQQESIRQILQMLQMVETLQAHSPT